MLNLNGPMQRANWKKQVALLLKTLALSLALINFFLFEPANGTSVGAENSSETPIENPLQVKGHINPFEIEAHQSFEMILELNLPEGYRAYEEQFKLKIVSPKGFKSQKFEIKPITEFYDEVTKKKKKGVLGKAILTAPFEAPEVLDSGESEISAILTYQACTKKYCLFPTDVPVKLAFKNKSAANQRPSLLQSAEEKILKDGLIWAFILSFLSGVLTSLTPCIFPMIPITISVLAKNAHLRSRKQNLIVSHFYVLGISVTYSILGVFAASTGQLFGSLISHPLVLGAMCAVFLAMSLSMFGLFEIQAPAFIRNRMGGDLHVHGYWGAFIYGLVAGIVASPCVGPVLVTILTYVAKTQNIWLGFWLLFTFSLGMGQLFLLLGVSSQATKLLPKSGQWMVYVKFVCAILMLGIFYYYLSFLLPLLFFQLSLGVGLILFGSLQGAFKKIGSGRRSQIWKRFCQLVVILGVIGVFYVPVSRNYLVREAPMELPENSASHELNLWKRYSQENLDLARQKKIPVIIDFWADWCAACIELDKKTFSHAKFETAAQKFMLLKYDATQNSEELEALRKKYGILGLPHVVFIDATGSIKSDFTINQFVEVEEFLKVMNKVAP